MQSSSALQRPGQQTPPVQQAGMQHVSQAKPMEGQGQQTITPSAANQIPSVPPEMMDKIYLPVDSRISQCFY